VSQQRLKGGQEQEEDDVVLLSDDTGDTNQDVSDSNELAADTNNSDDDDDDDDDDDLESKQEAKKVFIHTYRHNAKSNTASISKKADNDFATTTATTTTATINMNNFTLMGVGMSQMQFSKWVHYYLLHMTENGEHQSTPPQPKTQSVSSLQQVLDENQQQQQYQITSQEVNWESAEWETTHVPIIRQHWKEGRLICEHTNLLSGRPQQQKEQKEEDELESVLSEANTGENEEKNKEPLLNEEQIKAKKESEERLFKQEQFSNALRSYAERLASIVEDELSEDAHFLSSSSSNSMVDDAIDNSRPYNFGQVVDLPDRQQQRHNPVVQTAQQAAQHHATSPKWNTPNGLRGWIEQEFGVENTRLLMADTLLQKSEEEQLETFQSFLDWFRSKFPYFHDKCDSCGASCKDDPPPSTVPQPRKNGETITGHDVNNRNNRVDSGYQSDEPAVEEKDASSNDNTNNSMDVDEDEEISFLGYVNPSPTERLGNASRTELYTCRSCSAYTRFPRYNKALWVTSTQRGRCGEYSMLLYRMLRVLGYDKVRWVVDWSDHVWAEVWLGDSPTENNNKGRWVHLDPCEAAVDNPLLYESWGKNQTYIVAFHDPFYLSSGKDGATSVTVTGVEAKIPHAKTSLEIPEHENDILSSYHFPPVEDITRQYTSDEAHVIEDRRGIADEPVAEAIDEVSKNMVQLLQRLTQR